MVTEAEWQHLQRFFEVDQEIMVTRKKDGPELFNSSPEVCHECLLKKQEIEEKVFFSFAFHSS